jgi:glycosyltransferase involved in cell wall biosynthesis
MATYSDFDGTYFTVQSLLLHHQEALQDCEILVVDNAPHLPLAQTLQNYCRSVSSDERPVRYVPFGQAVGTSPARNAIFQHATGDYVLVLDCHVLLALGSLQRLREYLESHHPCDDLIQGVFLSDDCYQLWTHFADVWRAEMWGIWGTDPRGEDPDGEPFPIFAQGLGMFCARRESWLGFHPLARGFGGEECYIHEKYRRAGRQCLCLPGLRCVHRFARPGGVPYPLSQWNKVRNYVLEFRELGLSLDRLYRHFVEGIGEDPGDGSPPLEPLHRETGAGIGRGTLPRFPRFDPPGLGEGPLANPRAGRFRSGIYSATAGGLRPSGRSPGH